MGRRGGPPRPPAAAAGAAGAAWAADLELAQLFAVQVRQLEEALADVPADGLRTALDTEFVLAAFAAGRAWRQAQAGEWLDPWDVPGPVHDPGPAEADQPGADAEAGEAGSADPEADSSGQADRGADPRA